MGQMRHRTTKQMKMKALQMRMIKIVLQMKLTMLLIMGQTIIVPIKHQMEH